jgi:hypothetical protein
MNGETFQSLRNWAAACTDTLGCGQFRHLWTGLPAWTLLREGSGEVHAGRVALARDFGERPRQHSVEVCEIGSTVRYPRRLRTQMVADDDGGVRVLKHRRAGQQVKGRGSQGVLIRPTVKRPAQQLFGGHVIDGPQCDVGVGEVAGVIDSASDPEVC